MNEKFNKSSCPQQDHKLERKEAQSRVQLQTEVLMMTSLKASFQETSESERQAVFGACSST